MDAYRSFKDIFVCYDLDDFLLKRKETPQLAYLLQCIGGSMQMLYAGMEIRLEEGDLLFGSPDKYPQEIWHSDDFCCHIFAVEVNNLDDILYACLREEYGWVEKLRYLRRHPVIRLTPRKTEMIEAYRTLVRFYQTEDCRYKKRVAFLQAQAIIFELMAWVAEEKERNECVDAESDSRQMSAEVRLNQLFLLFHKLLDETHAGQRQVKWYADEMHITTSYLNVVCKHVVGKAPQQVINEIVIQEAKQRLTGADESIKEIAFFMHFSSESAFCKYFRAKTGMSPSEFRQLQHGSGR